MLPLRLFIYSLGDSFQHFFMGDTASEPQLVEGPPPADDDSLIEAALKCLMCADVKLKAKYTNLAVALWRTGNMVVQPAPGRPPILVPDRE